MGFTWIVLGIWSLCLRLLRRTYLIGNITFHKVVIFWSFSLYQSFVFDGLLPWMHSLTVFEKMMFSWLDRLNFVLGLDLITLPGIVEEQVVASLEQITFILACCFYSSCRVKFLSDLVWFCGFCLHCCVNAVSSSGDYNSA